MNIAILGFGLQGKSAYNYWKNGNDITICDRKEIVDLPNDVRASIGDDYLSGLDVYDLIVRSPIIHPDDIVAANSPEILKKVTSNTNEFFRVCPSKNIIGVTGTKGKGTTSTLVTKILEQAGERVHLGGNIGTPPLDLLDGNIQPDDWVVLELANFQLIDLEYSPHIAACLMVNPEHLDWHNTTDKYFEAKSQLFAHQTDSDVAIHYADNEDSHAIASVSSGAKIPYLAEPGALVINDFITIDNQKLCNVSELKLPGEHNWQNVCAAVTIAWQITKDVAAIRNAVTTFSGLPYRIEFRDEINGISYYNDSFATGPGATIAAIKAIKEPKIMIIGGFDRGLDLSELTQEIIDSKNKVKSVLLIGASAERVANALKANNYHDYVASGAKTMPEIIAKANNLAKSGDAIVLSPSFASFDMFKNFEDRGQKFNEAVASLA